MPVRMATRPPCKLSKEEILGNRSPAYCGMELSAHIRCLCQARGLVRVCNGCLLRVDAVHRALI